MKDGDTVWLVGRAGSHANWTYHVVEARKVGEVVDGRQTVDTRNGGCRSAMLETVPVEKCYPTEAAAIERKAELESEVTK